METVTERAPLKINGLALVEAVFLSATLGELASSFTHRLSIDHPGIEFEASSILTIISLLKLPARLTATRCFPSSGEMVLISTKSLPMHPSEPLVPGACGWMPNHSN
jgi:hypothetical protein